MNNKKLRTRAKWLATALMVLSLMLLASQSVLPQEMPGSGTPPAKDSPTVIHPLGDIALDAATYRKYLKVQPTGLDLALPNAYDARADGIVTPAKNQGACGSCWAFATVGAMESHLLKAGYPYDPKDLSEQQQVSCNTANYGCSGGYSSAATYWQTKGPQYEWCYPYTASDSPCAEGACEQLGYRVVGWHTVPATTAGFKTSLYEDGPSYWRYGVYSDFDTFWSSGSPGQVYVSQANKTYRGGHAVLLIGWDDSKGAYLCKNSWGGGGPNGDGTFWIAYSGHYYNLGFGMSNFDVISLGCETDAECDDGTYCNGAESCVAGACQAGTPPSCGDDGDYCNGSEICDESAQGCGHTGDPCGTGTICNPGGWCDDVACFDSGDCDDGSSCTTDTCYNAGTAGAYCGNVWAVCGVADGCCGPTCTTGTDPDCTSCGNGVCELGEDCNSCSADCISGTAGGTCGACFKGQCDNVCHPKKEDASCSDCAPSYCCGDGVCSGAENTSNCALDCPAAGCSVDGDCDDGLWCNGSETCAGGTCQDGGSVSCPSGEVCDEATDRCIAETDCSACFKGVCDGKCNPNKEGTGCPDCPSQNIWAITSG